ncbi:MAG: 50S ribosomal protein L29 [Promicromonosporaceae bacterium]|nr:50S ribosomal protein L29 [Promicromonosporaceae bacterium]
MAKSSTGLAAADLEAKTNEELEKELAKSKEALFNMRFQSATGQLETNHRIPQVKRDIARILTILRERELGIREVPAAK